MNLFMKTVHNIYKTFLSSEFNVRIYVYIIIAKITTVPKFTVQHCGSLQKLKKELTEFVSKKIVLLKDFPEQRTVFIYSNADAPLKLFSVLSIKMEKLWLTFSFSLATGVVSSNKRSRALISSAVEKERLCILLRLSE